MNVIEPPAAAPALLLPAVAALAVIPIFVPATLAATCVGAFTLKVGVPAATSFVIEKFCVAEAVGDKPRIAKPFASKTEVVILGLVARRLPLPVVRFVPSVVMPLPVSPSVPALS